VVGQSKGKRAVIILTAAQYDQMLAHVLADPAQERCGLLAGREGRVERVLPVPNSLNSPWEYQMDGQEFVEAMRACDFEPLGIFHSHVNGPPTPSPTDVAKVTYPESTYLIISLHQVPPSVRGFRFVNGRVSEVELRVEG
jgi:proteasome lid subunit RPN8/RPN11